MATLPYILNDGAEAQEDDLDVELDHVPPGTQPRFSAGAAGNCGQPGTSPAIHMPTLPVHVVPAGISPEDAEEPSPLSFQETETQPPPPVAQLHQCSDEDTPDAVMPARPLRINLDAPTAGARSASPIPPTQQLADRTAPTITARNALFFVPCTKDDAAKVLQVEKVTNADMSTFMTLLRVRRASKLPKEIKADIVAHKMVELSVCLKGFYDLIAFRQGRVDVLNDNAEKIRRCAPCDVSVRRDSAGSRFVDWGDEDDSAVQVDVQDGSGERASAAVVFGVDTRTPPAGFRQADFECGEYGRLLHVLGDSRMAMACQRLMRPRTREELDAAPSDPWDDSISVLFNDVDFAPQSVRLLAGGVTRSDIDGVDPSQRPFERTAATLKTKWGQFKSLYGTCVTRFEASGQGDIENFRAFADGRSYVMYAFCFFKENPLLEPLATRTLPREAQREEGIPGDGGSDADAPTPRSSSKRRRTGGGK